MKGLARLFGLGPDAAISPADKKQPPETAVEPEEYKDAEAPAMPEKEVRLLPIDEIVPNPFQPRKKFNEAALADLAASIGEFGIIQPLVVRQIENSFELVAGERRLRASKLAGLKEVPVVIKMLTDKETAEIAMIENLQREDLHFMEEAAGFAQLLENFGFTQEELAGRMSKSQSTIANKLRLLKLSEAVCQRIFDDKITERHARALLRLPSEALQLQALQLIADKSLNVRDTEALIQKMLDDTAKGKKKKKVIGLVRDVRIFINTIDQMANQMKQSGFRVKVQQEQSEDSITIKMVIPKQKK